MFKSIYSIGDTVYFTHTRGRRVKLSKGRITGIKAIPDKKDYDYYYTIDDNGIVYNDVYLSQLFAITDVIGILITLVLLITFVIVYERMLR